MPWGKKAKNSSSSRKNAKQSSPWGSNSKKAKATKKPATISPELTFKFDKVRKVAPPDPKAARYTWLSSAYHMRRALGDTKAELLTLAKAMGYKVGDPSIRAIINETAAKHMTKKVKDRYVSILEQALQADIHSSKLAKFIDDAGGINNCAKRPKSQWLKAKLTKAESKVKSPKSGWLQATAKAKKVAEE